MTFTRKVQGQTGPSRRLCSFCVISVMTRMQCPFVQMGRLPHATALSAPGSPAILRLKSHHGFPDSTVMQGVVVLIYKQKMLLAVKTTGAAEDA